MTTKQQHKRSYANYIGSLGGVPAAPVNTVAPSITGTAQVGETLTAADGTWTGRPAPALTRVWEADGVAIAGATGTTYVPVEGDVGKTITATVTATNIAGNASETSAATAAVAPADVAPVNTAVPTITGTAQVGATLTVSNGTWTGSPTPTYTRTWSADGAVIAGATATTYVPVEGDIDKAITATVRAVNTAGNASATSAATGAVVAAE